MADICFDLSCLLALNFITSVCSAVASSADDTCLPASHHHLLLLLLLVRGVSDFTAADNDNSQAPLRGYTRVLYIVNRLIHRQCATSRVAVARVT